MKFVFKVLVCLSSLLFFGCEKKRTIQQHAEAPPLPTEPATKKPKPQPKSYTPSEEEKTEFAKTKAKAKTGDSEMQLELAEKFYYGRGVEIDYTKSFKWASLSAAQDSPKAQYRLASLYIQGRGISKDENKAIILFEEAAKGLLQCTPVVMEQIRT